MNKSQMAKLAAAAGVNGLMYDPKAEGVFGNVQGYTVTIMPNANNRVYYMLSLSVSRMGMAPNPADFKPLEKMNKVLSGCTCLLYTSPSPRDTERSRMPSSA